MDITKSGDITKDLQMHLVKDNVAKKEEERTNKIIDLTFKIPMLPPSVNSAYKINFKLRHTYLSEEGRTFKLLAKQYMPPCNLDPNSTLSIYIEYHGNWFTKESKIRKADGMNLEKLVFDAISDKIGVDDSRFWKWGGEKVQDVEEYCLVKIKGVTNE